MRFSPTAFSALPTMTPLKSKQTRGVVAGFWAGIQCCGVDPTCKLLLALVEIPLPNGRGPAPTATHSLPDVVERLVFPVPLTAISFWQISPGDPSPVV